MLVAYSILSIFLVVFYGLSLIDAGKHIVKKSFVLGGFMIVILIGLWTTYEKPLSIIIEKRKEFATVVFTSPEQTLIVNNSNYFEIKDTTNNLQVNDKVLVFYDYRMAKDTTIVVSKVLYGVDIIKEFTKNLE